MCGRFALPITVAAIKEYIAVHHTLLTDYMPRFNIAPGMMVPVVTQDESGVVLDVYRWGLIPFWAKDEQVGYKMINARQESVTEKPSFKNPFKKKRCLIPASGFFEWKKDDSGKTPYYIHCTDRPLFAFAGLWDAWKSPAGSLVKTCTILTTEADLFMSDLHHRMPVILQAELMTAWISPDITESNYVYEIIRSCHPDLEAWPVSKYVNSPNNNSVQCIEQIEK